VETLYFINFPPLLMSGNTDQFLRHAKCVRLTHHEIANSKLARYGHFEDQKRRSTRAVRVARAQETEIYVQELR
jgi:hypothetical protein